MNFKIISILLFFLLFQNINFLYAENLNNDFEKSTGSPQRFESLPESKIQPILIQWQLSDNPKEFATQNHLSHSGDKIAVYIHLVSLESRLEIPSDIEITGFDQKISAALVTSEQLEKLGKL